MEPDDAERPSRVAQSGVSRVRRHLRSAMEHGVVQLVRGSGFIFACRVGGAVLALVTQWVLARWMGAEDLGSYLLAYSWCILVARLSGLGYNSAAPRFIAQGIALDDRRAVRGFVDFSTRAALGVGTAVALIGVSATFALATRSGVGPWPMVIAFAAVPIMAYSGLLQGFALAVSDLRSSFVPNEVLRPALFPEEEEVYLALVPVHLLQPHLHGVPQTKDLLRVFADERVLILGKGVVIVAEGADVDETVDEVATAMAEQGDTLRAAIKAIAYAQVFRLK